MEFSAAVLNETGGPLAIERLEMTGLKARDVLVKVQASGLCHTDLEVILGSLKAPLPIVLGHEGAGIVEAVGSEVTMAKPGDHVICSWNPNCGHCFYCVRDQPILCEAFSRSIPSGTLLDGAVRLRSNGRNVHHHCCVSSHAEYCVLPESGAIVVPKDIPFDRACLIGCGVMTGVEAVTRIAKGAVGSSIATFGCGAVGLNVVQGARLAGAGMIAAIDVDDGKVELARRPGATHTINATREDPVSALKALSAGRGADYGFESAGSEKSIQQTLEATRPGGHAVILGKVAFDSNISLRFGSLMGEKQITRSAYGGARPSRDFPLLAEYYLEGKLKLDELITDRLPLAEISTGFAKMKAGGGIRTVITFPN